MGSGVICCNGLTKIQAGNPIFENISFTLHHKELMACFGEGRHEFIEILMGKDKDYIGELKLDDSIGSVLQTDTIALDQTPLKVLQDANIKHDTDYVLLGMLEMAVLDKKRDVFCSQLSHGEMRRLLLLREILKVPNLIVLEDVFFGIPDTDKKIIQNILFEATTYISVIVTLSSSEEEKELADQILNLDTGQVTLLPHKDGKQSGL